MFHFKIIYLDWYIDNIGSEISRQFFDTNTKNALRHMGIKNSEVVDSPLSNTTYFIFGQTIDKIKKEYIFVPDQKTCKEHEGSSCRDNVFKYLQADLRNEKITVDEYPIKLLNKYVTQVNNVDV